MTKKYKLLQNDTIKLYGITLYRIQALKDFADVSTGDLGGYIESEENLSHEGSCWVYGGATVSGNARVFGNAEVYGNARVFGNAEIYGNAKVSWNAKVYGNASISQNAIIKKTSDYLTISPIGSRNDILTAYKTSDNIYVKVGCFNGSLKAFEKAVEETHGDSKYGEEYKSVVELIKKRLGDSEYDTKI